MPSTFGRVAIMTALIASPTLAAERVTVTLDWTPNTNFVGLYVADALGFYEEAGLDVAIQPFEFGQTPGDISAFGVLDFYTAKARGLDAIGVYAFIQTETGRLAFSGDHIARPRDLEGKRYGGFGTSWEKAIVDQMITQDGGEPIYETGRFNGSVYDALRAGEIDFTLEVMTWQGIENEIAGNNIGSFRYADYGIPDQHTILLAADAGFLSERADTASSFIAATKAGYAYAVEHPVEAAEVLIAAAPELKDQSELVERSMQVMVEGHYLISANGTIGRFNDVMMTDLGDFLFDAEALVDTQGMPLPEKPNFDLWYTNLYLD